ncbi:MAG: ABC transporter ATP-binding protein [Pseudolabrys sp.]|nr:ABC transporter ATP-binding protein [Pseudolabrys sp.]
MSALVIQGLSKRFAGLQAVKAVSFDVPDKSIVALIGPNGAGKTTTFNLIAGAIRRDEGSVTLDGRRIDGMSAHDICHAGVARTFQLVRPFGELNVEDNVLVGCLHAEHDVARARQRAELILRRLGLHTQRKRLASSLTLPDRKRLEVARALGTEPKVLLLDEVMAGLRPTETDQMVEFFREINRELGVTILLIEHVMRAVMALAQKVVVLNYGQKIAEGLPQDVVRDKAVLECYLGEEAI